MNGPAPELSIVIPACNEQDRLPPTLDAYLARFDALLPGRFEALVVVNGSTDGTERIVREYAARHDALRPIIIPERVGKGGAVLRGLREARGLHVGFVDADGATAPEEFDRLRGFLDRADVVIASRWHPESVIPTAQSLGRRISSRLFNGMVRLLFRLEVSDTQCGAKVFRRSALEAILPDLGHSHWIFDVDLLYLAKRAGFRIHEEPTVWNDVEGSKLRPFAALFDIPYALLRLRLLYSPLARVVLAWDRLIGRRAFEHQLRAGRLSTRDGAQSGRRRHGV